MSRPSTARTVIATTTDFPEAGRRVGVREAAHIDDREFVVRLIKRDAIAWDEFLDEYGRLIAARSAATLRELGRTASGAVLDDCCAEVIAALLHNDAAALRRFAGRSKFSTWLAVVARRVTLRHCQRSRREQPAVHGDSQFELAAWSPEEDANDSRTAAMGAARAELSEADQRVLTLFYDDGCSYREIAERLNVSVNTVGPKLQRAQQRLRTLMERTNDEHTRGTRHQGGQR